MADRENLVYQAKLAEQAERYDGKAPSFPRRLGSFPTVSLPRGDPSAGTAVHMDWSDERQNGGGFVGRMNL